MTVTTIDATTATYYRVYRNSTVYATARSTSDNYSAGPVIGQNFSTPNYSVYRVAFKFDTSGLSGQVVSDATIRLVLTNDQSATDFDIQVVGANWSASDPIGAGTCDAIFDLILAETTSVVVRNTSGIATSTQYTSPSLPVGWVNTSGSTYVGLRSSRDYDANTPTGLEYIEFKSPADGNASYHPALIVTHAAAAGTSIPVFMNQYRQRRT